MSVAVSVKSDGEMRRSLLRLQAIGFGKAQPSTLSFCRAL
jgi:hypothetical protein